MANFVYEIEQQVTAAEHNVTGTVQGRAEYSRLENQYYVGYLGEDGIRVEQWFSESELTAA